MKTLITSLDAQYERKSTLKEQIIELVAWQVNYNVVFPNGSVVSGNLLWEKPEVVIKEMLQIIEDNIKTQVNA